MLPEIRQEEGLSAAKRKCTKTGGLNVSCLA